MNTIPRLWRNAVLDALSRVADRQRSDLISRRSLVYEELNRIADETQSQGKTPDQTLSKILQDLADEGLLEFVSRVQYRLLAGSVQIEKADLSNDEIDRAMEGGRLRCGEVPNRVGSRVDTRATRTGESSGQDPLLLWQPVCSVRRP